jgi:hypothetical protein
VTESSVPPIQAHALESRYDPTLAPRTTSIPIDTHHNPDEPTLPLGVPLSPTTVAFAVAKDPAIAGHKAPDTIAHPPPGSIVTLEKSPGFEKAHPVVDDTADVLNTFAAVTGVRPNVSEGMAIDHGVEHHKKPLMDTIKDAVGVGHPVAHISDREMEKARVSDREKAAEFENAAAQRELKGANPGA